MESNVGSPVLSATESLYITPNTIPEEEESNDVGSNIVIIIAIVASTIVLIGLFILIYCLYKKKLAMQETIANQVLEKDSVDVIDVEEIDKSHNIIMSDDVFFGQNSFVQTSSQATQPSPKKPRNRRVRNRQVL